MKFSFTTLGCKVNQYETDIMKQDVINNSHEIVADSEFADVYVVNTCTVTNEADRKSKQMIRRFKRLNPGSIVVATGCMAQVEYPELEDMTDLVIDNGRKECLVKTVEDYLKNGDKTGYFDRAYWLSRKLHFTSETISERTRAYVMIEEGCDRCCTYCKIYHARGTVINSKPLNLILDEVAGLQRRGIKEIVLTGINLGKYDSEGADLADVLERINLSAGDIRIRLSSMDPDLLDDRILDILSEKKFCRHMHLSIQSGSDQVLKAMNRQYPVRKVIEAADNLRKIDPRYSITTDIIVGFPGETEEDFSHTCELMKRIEPLKVHIFKYSPKSKTKAALMKNQIPFDVKKNRSDELFKITEVISKKFREYFIGRNTEVLIENIDGNISGHDEYYLLHTFIANENNDVGVNQLLISKIKNIDEEENDRVVSEIVELS